ncbi:phosphatase PAP2 family protein [Natrialbaceae archaeon AArc-T1-2]|uniref:phosphatase PAP2 family protein n=1 Tax=Natrialbaceae archaeon AArc-T1-2 TaxID=3053904 RepID=UPI00255AF3BE|nr:phosphatase PAP2 family protein [Natrialbaceae archaeon AArc-T1-2]WIV67192.1 phosphatase PAP2 family protein [Natrialbaceae archaeon AArc-T1-2]
MTTNVRTRTDTADPVRLPLDGSSSSPSFDGREIEWLHALFPEWTSYPFAASTLLGEVWVFVFVFALAFWFGDARRIAPLFGVVFGGLALVVVLKAAVALPRPPMAAMIPPETAHDSVRPWYRWAIRADGYGFPSGHVAGAVLAWGSLATALEAGTRRIRIGTAATLVLLVSLSRLVLGVHYLIDVIGGLALGLLVLLAWQVASRRLERPVRASLAAAVGCASVPAAVGVGGSEPLYALGAMSGILTAWLLVVDPDRSLDVTPVGVVTAVVGIVVFLSVGATVGSLLSGPVGSVTMTFAMGVTIVAWPTAVDSVLS